MRKETLDLPVTGMVSSECCRIPVSATRLSSRPRERQTVTSWIRSCSCVPTMCQYFNRGQFVRLVTCYPFYFIGSAPQRYIVRASITNSERIGVAGVIEPEVVHVNASNRPK